MYKDRKVLIYKAMQLYGGSFAAALGEAWALADLENAERLERAFPEIFEKYAEIAETGGS